MFATEGPFALEETQSMPATMPAVEPVPSQPSTRTGTTSAPLATPYREPAVVPATCVPWPLQSLLPRPSSTAVTPGSMRPRNSEWEARTPVSMMKAVTPAPVAL